MKKIVIMLILCILYSMTGCSSSASQKEEKAMKSIYGVNREISGAYDGRLAAQTRNGVFVGTEKNGVISYKGIPFAQAPTGELRWKAPVAAEKSSKVVEAYYYGKSCIQTQWPTEMASFYEQGEDCLYLNIWSNTHNTSHTKPVMVFIHGGSYGWGGTSDPIYDGQNFIETNGDVILVTIGYRIGIMGFIDFSSIQGGSEFQDSGNLGILDQIMALKWIQENISNFGGDPTNVTIFGESAGAGSVSILTVLPQARGLFNRAIAESGSIALTYSKEECQPLTKKLVEKTGASSMQDLMALREDELKELNESLNDYNNFPERGDSLIPEDLYAAYEQGEGSDIDLLIGTNADEVRYWIGEMGGLLPYTLLAPVMYENNLSKISSDDKANINQFMASQNNAAIWNISEFYNELLFRVPAVMQSVSHSRNGGNTYMYYWTYPSAVKNYGACHAVELAYVFNNLENTIFTGNNVNKDLAVEVQKMWVNFAKTGNPGTDEFFWPKYDENTRQTLVLGSEIKVESDILSQQRKEIEPLMKYHFNGSYSNLSLAVPYVYKLAALTAAVIGVLLLIGFKVFKKREK